MRTPLELRELAAYHRRLAENAPEENQVWRTSLADCLETVADANERTGKADTGKPLAFAP